MGKYNYYKGKNARRQSAKYYAMRYNEFLDEYNSLKDSVSSMNLDGMPHGTNVGNPTERLAIRRNFLEQRMEAIENTAKDIDSKNYRFILRYATQGTSYEYMNTCGGLYMSKSTFHRKLNRFYELLADRLEVN